LIFEISDLYNFGLDFISNVNPDFLGIKDFIVIVANFSLTPHSTCKILMSFHAEETDMIKDQHYKSFHDIQMLIGCSVRFWFSGRIDE
jgi:high-affinity nickel permease